MEELDSDVPLPKAQQVVGIIYNLKKNEKKLTSDMDAEYDSIDTVYAIREALEKHGCRTLPLEADAGLFEKLQTNKIDFAFNIAEGVCGRGREAQIPAILDMLRIPYTGSDVTTLGIALDKAITKRLLSTYKIKTPKYAVIPSSGACRISGLRYPVIVKPNAEGSSKGISDISIADNRDALVRLASRNIELYGEDMLAEEYIGGREFTVGILGNGADMRVFTPMEIAYRKNTQDKYCVYSYGVKQNYKEYIDYKCPSDIGEKVEAEMIAAAAKIYSVLGCRDFSRIDFRVSESGTVYFIEINPLPGLAPGYSDYPMLAGFCGMQYDELVCSILRAAQKRYGLLQ